MSDTTTKSMAEAMAQMRRVFASRSEAALVQGSPAIATLGEGTLCTITGAEGEKVLCDLSPAAGGRGAAPSPGWYLRAALAACTSTLLKQRAAELGIALDALEVRVDSRLDIRGALGMDDVPPTLQDLQLTIRVRAAGEPEQRLRDIADWAAEHSPTLGTVRRGSACRVSVEVG